MTYIIEDVNLVKNNHYFRTSLLVNDDKILSVQPSFSKYTYTRMKADNFLMSPTYSFFQIGHPTLPADMSKKSFFIKTYLIKGCTTVVASTGLTEYLHDIEPNVEAVKRFYLDSPVDFTVILRVPISIFSVQLVQKCKRRKIPGIIVEFNDQRDLYKIPWGWIKEALFPYNCPLIPAVKDKEKKEACLSAWRTILEREKIPHIKDPLEEGKPLDLNTKKKIGIYPLKGYLQTGGELSYNLYFMDTEGHYNHEDILQNQEPNVTVHKGNIIRVENKIYYNENNGEETIINRPAFFK